MCGIIGFLGEDNFTEYVLDGLKLIQNRGYDSVGIAYIENGDLYCCKRASLNNNDSLSVVTDIVLKSDIKSNIAIGHTRWATHGNKTDINAHPHIDFYNNIALVHNGIIENYLEIKAMLVEKGIIFQSQTDTEIISSLIGYYYKNGNTVNESINLAISQLNGTWALTIICKDIPNKMWITRNGSPILLGLDDNFAMVVSEQTAFSNYVNKFIPVDNNDVMEISLDNGKISYNKIICENKIILKSQIEFDKSPAPYKFWMEKEIFTQPQHYFNAINNGGRLNSESTVMLGGLEHHKDALNDIDHLTILGCGTSYNAGLWSLQMFKSLNIFKSVSIYDGAEFNTDDIYEGKNAFIFLSQSGETRDLIRCLDIAKNKSIITIGIVNGVDSFIARETTCGIYLNAGPEFAVASTKSFTNQCIVLTLLVIWFAQHKDVHIEKRINMIRDIRMLYVHIENILNKSSCVDELLRDYDISQSCFILGKGVNQAISYEGALKLKEIAYIHAEGFSSSALKHGPFALIVDNLPIFIIDTDYINHEKNMNAYNEVKCRGAKTIMISSILSNSELTVDTNNTFGGVLSNIYFQLIAYKIALLRGNNPDFPRNLAKVVTVE
jgi:glucosamine--fructose-6-phosphate aminotransferase (isomerizing)